MARVARCYGWTHDEIMATYWRSFFSYARQVPRLQAEEDLRALYLMRASQSDEKGFKRMANDLRKQMRIEAAAPKLPKGMTLADKLLGETKGQRLVDGSIKLAEPGSLMAEIEAKRKKFSGGV